MTSQSYSENQMSLEDTFEDKEDGSYKTVPCPDQCSQSGPQTLLHIRIIWALEEFLIIPGIHAHTV